MAKRRKRRIPVTKAVDPETCKEQREKFPKELVNAFIKLDKTAKLISENGIIHYAWTDRAYKQYAAEAIKYLGKTDAADPILTGRLVVLLSKATFDIREEIIRQRDEKNVTNKKKAKKKASKKTRRKSS